MKELVFDGSQNYDGQLPAGEWDLEIVGVKKGESAAGNTCLDIQFKEVNDAGRYFDRIPWMEKTFFRVQQLIAACGFDPKAKYTFDDLCQDLPGSVVRANIVIEPRADTGEERARAKTFSKIG